MAEVVNIAAYRFVPLEDLPRLRERLLALCKSLDLRGTILLSPEGINLFVAGRRPEVDELLAALRAVPGLENLAPKESISEDQPFRRMLVRIKREIIAFGVSGIEPGRRTSPKLPPKELKRWLDEGRPVTLLDTRNDYEVRAGTFHNAVTLPINHFRDFPSAVSRLPGELKQQPIVMFCTGGIRCEKAGPFMEREGFQNVFQLDGGILKYFEECGGAHYRGECFVFDRRVGVDATLEETETAQCFNCQATLSAADQEDPRYMEGQSCPSCYLTDAERMGATIARRHEALRRVTTPMPGSVPYDQDRPVRIPAKYEGEPLLAALQGIFPHLPRQYWDERFTAKLVLNRDRKPVTPEHRVSAGERYLNRTPLTAEPDVNAAIRVLYEDEAIVVIEKPAPLPVHPSGRFSRNTLLAFLYDVYWPQKLRPVHRLDANTTGLVLFARTSRFASLLHPQFEIGEVEKVYVARVQGTPPEDEFVCDAPIGSETTDVGGRRIDESGRPSRTEFRVLERLADGTSLVESRPVTGRTNQIRLHLWHLGWPVLGEQAYLPGGQLGAVQTHAVGEPPLCLHARRLSFRHPISHEWVMFESEPPEWAAAPVANDGEDVGA